MTNFKRVKEFMMTFGQDVKKKAVFPEKKIQDLRISLIEEELQELKEAIKNSWNETTLTPISRSIFLSKAVSLRQLEGNDQSCDEQSKKNMAKNDFLSVSHNG